MKNLFYFRLFAQILLLLLLLSGRAHAQCSTVSTNGYVVNVTIKPVSLVPSSAACPYGYNYNINFTYSVTFTGVNVPASLYTLQVTFTCNNAGNSANFAQLPTTPGSGSLTTSSNPYRSTPDCATASIALLDCNHISVLVQGPGVDTTISCDYLERPLPVTLTSFTALRNGLQVDLRWATASEVNNAGYTVEQSPDGQQWLGIAQVPGAGTSLAAHTYQASVAASRQVAYYRLRCTDAGGTAAYSAVAVVPLALVTTLPTLVPNPNASQQFTVLGLDLPAPVDLRLYDTLGRLWFHTTLTDPVVSLPTLPAGLYAVQLRAGSETPTTLRYLQQ